MISSEDVCVGGRIVFGLCIVRGGFLECERSHFPFSFISLALTFSLKMRNAVERSENKRS